MILRTIADQYKRGHGGRREEDTNLQLHHQVPKPLVTGHQHVIHTCLAVCPKEHPGGVLFVNVVLGKDSQDGTVIRCQRLQDETQTVEVELFSTAEHRLQEAARDTSVQGCECTHAMRLQPHLSK